MAQNFTTDTTQWQGVDDEPTAGSDNLVKSGGVYDALDKASEISKEVDVEVGNEVIIKDDNDNVVFKADENGVDAKNLKSNGRDVLTQHQDISGKADKSYVDEELEKKQDLIPQIESGNAEDADNEQIWSNNDESEVYAKINHEGILGKDFLYYNNNKVNSLVPKDASYVLAVNNSGFANIYSIIKRFEGKHVTLRCTSTTNHGFYQIVFYRNSETIYGNDTKTIKGYWRQMWVPEDITNCVIYTNVDTSVTFEIAEAKFYEFARFSVGKTGINNYSSILEAVMSSSKYQSSIIDVNSGEYDIREEFENFYGENFFTNFAYHYNDTQQTYSPLGIYLSNNVHLKFSPDSLVTFTGDNTNEDALKWFGPFFASYNGFTLEGLTINTANCRYCIHDERTTQTDFYKNYYKNCHFHHNNTDPINNYLYSACIGGGLGVNGLVDIEGCYFETDSAASTPKTAFSYHNSNSADAKSRIVIRDNYVAGYGYFRFGDYGPSTKMTEVIVCGNNFGSAIVHNGEAGSTNVNGIIIEWNNIIRNV